MPQQNRISVLLVSAAQRESAHLLAMLPPDRCHPVSLVGSAGEARRVMTESPYDLILIRPPLPDELALRLAEDLSRYPSVSILLLVGAEQYDQIAWQAEELGVMVLARPLEQRLFEQALGLVRATRSRLRQVELRADTLEQKMEDIRLVNRAKLLLMERRGMNEAEAHRYIEKRAMDTGRKRRDVAEELIRQVQDSKQ
jgi:AmiR/NasT family two-component response regulator